MLPGSAPRLIGSSRVEQVSVVLPATPVFVLDRDGGEHLQRKNLVVIGGPRRAIIGDRTVGVLSSLQGLPLQITEQCGIEDCGGEQRR